MTARVIEVRRTRNGWWQVRGSGGLVVFSLFSSRDQAAAFVRESRLTAAAAVLDEHLPLRGPCLICGVPGEDQTHRVIDAIAEHFRAGEDPAAIAEDYGVPVQVVPACAVWSPR